MRKPLAYLAIIGCGCAASAASGQDAAQITVTATGTPIPLADTGQPVTVIGRDEIDAVQGADLTRVLARAPGVSVSRNGAPGSFTGVRVRGDCPAPARHRPSDDRQPQPVHRRDTRRRHRAGAAAGGLALQPRPARQLDAA